MVENPKVQRMIENEERVGTKRKACFFFQNKSSCPSEISAKRDTLQNLTILAKVDAPFLRGKNKW